MLTGTAQPSTITSIMTNWLSVQEAAELTGYNGEYLKQCIRHDRQLEEEKGIEPRFTAIKKAGVWLIEPESLQAYVNKMKELGGGKHDPTRKRG